MAAGEHDDSPLWGIGTARRELRAIIDVATKAPGSGDKKLRLIVRHAIAALEALPYE